MTEVPSTPEELLAWAKAHPNKFGYARPANSGPGRTFLMGLPYILGDSAPTDPENGWSKTWAYLKELGQSIDNYPTGTGQVISNVADGTWSMIPTTTGWEIEPRTDGRLPNTLQAAAFDTFTWVTDAHYAAIPRGQSADKTAAILLLLQDMLTPEAPTVGPRGCLPRLPPPADNAAGLSRRLPPDRAHRDEATAPGLPGRAP